jgi:surface protein
MVIKYGSAPKRFQSIWDTTQAGSANDTVVLPLQSAGSYNFYIDWGDGKENRDNITVYNQAEVTHQYDTTGIYTIKVVGEIIGWKFNNGGDDDKITEISNWGPLIINDNAAFNGCSLLTLSTTDRPTITTSNVTNMFRNCTSLVNADFSNWDVSNLTNFTSMFQSCTNFISGNFSSWNTTGATTFSNMFNGCTSFIDEGVWNFDISNTPILSLMFNNCDQLGGEFGFDLSNYFPINFNNNSVRILPDTPYWANYSASGINFSSGVNGLFYNAEFSNSLDQAQALNNNPTWSGVKVTYYLFAQSVMPTWITGLDTSNMERIEYTFWFGNNFTSGFVNDWDFTSATSLQGMFGNTFNLPDITWGTKTSGISNFSYLFYRNSDSTVNFPNFDIDTRSATDMSFMFDDTRYNGTDHTGWDTSNVTNMSTMFRGTTSFNQSVEMWDVSKVTNMSSMFNQAEVFDQPLSGWNTSSLTNISSMFNGLFDLYPVFDQDLSTWIVTGVTSASNFMSSRKLRPHFKRLVIASSSKRSQYSFWRVTIFNRNRTCI